MKNFNIYIPNSNKEESDDIEGPVTMTEVLNFLKQNMKIFKSLGHINGYSSEFFKFLWVGFIMRAINNSNILLHFQNQIS